jgi:osmotically inducible lipoprotein OsmB
MKTKFLASIVTAAALMGLGGCASTGMDRTTVGTVGGAVVGGLVGSAVGGTGATLLGAGAGAYLGNQAAKR